MDDSWGKTSAYIFVEMEDTSAYTPEVGPLVDPLVDPLVGPLVDPLVDPLVGTSVAQSEVISPSLADLDELHPTAGCVSCGASLNTHLCFSISYASIILSNVVRYASISS